MDRLGKPIGFLRTTAIGGLLFLLPLIVLGALIGQVIPIVRAIAEAVGELVPVKTPAGMALLIGLALVVLLLLCFAAGLVARWSLGKAITAAFEKRLVLLFPRYAILKDQMAGSIGGEHNKPNMKPVLVTLDDTQHIAYETERSQDGKLVAVFMPGSPDPWSGHVAIMSAARVAPLDIEFRKAASTCEQLGRGSMELLGKQAGPLDSSSGH